MSVDLINHFLQSYGYLAVFLFVALESIGSPGSARRYGP